MRNPVSAAAGRRATPQVSRRARRLGALAAGYGLVWWALAGGDPWSWVVGVPAVVAAALLNLSLAPPRAAAGSVAGCARFLPFFLWQSLRGGLDVALRAFAPALPLQPGFVHYPWRLPEGPARVLFANAVSLAPGTLSALVEDDSLTVHVLDLGRPIGKHLAALEVRVAGVFGLGLGMAPDRPGEADGTQGTRGTEVRSG